MRSNHRGVSTAELFRRCGRELPRRECLHERRRPGARLWARECPNTREIPSALLAVSFWRKCGGLHGPNPRGMRGLGERRRVRYHFVRCVFATD